MITSHNTIRLLFRLQNLILSGYVVVCMDSRGSFGRGINFEKPIKNAMVGTFMIFLSLSPLLAMVYTRYIIIYLYSATIGKY